MPSHSKTVNDRVEKLAEGFAREVIGELRGLRGGSILACGCMHVNMCPKQILLLTSSPPNGGCQCAKTLGLGLTSPHTAGQRRQEGGGQRAVAGEPSNDDELWRTWFFLL